MCILVKLRKEKTNKKRNEKENHLNKKINVKKQNKMIGNEKKRRKSTGAKEHVSAQSVYEDVMLKLDQYDLNKLERI